MTHSNAILTEFCVVPRLGFLLKENLRYLRQRLKDRPHPVRAILIKGIVFYQRHLSRHTCLYEPTCSEYTKRCIHIHGAILGVLLGVLRILRCNPFSKGGIDPAPERRSKVRWLI